MRGDGGEAGGVQHVAAAEKRASGRLQVRGRDTAPRIGNRGAAHAYAGRIDRAGAAGGSFPHERHAGERRGHAQQMISTLPLPALPSPIRGKEPGGKVTLATADPNSNEEPPMQQSKRGLHFAARGVFTAFH
jgi:hypothetical protein